MYFNFGVGMAVLPRVPFIFQKINRADAGVMEQMAQGKVAILILSCL